MEQNKKGKIGSSKKLALGRLFITYLEEISSDENSEEYLKENGCNPDKLVDNTIREVKKRLISKGVKIR